MSLVASEPAATACLSPRECRQLHCAVCTAHLANPQQRFCTSRCRSRARSLRKALAYCPQCRAPLWLPKALARRLRPGGSTLLGA